MPAIKAHYRGEIRRFNFEEEIELSELHRTLKKLFRVTEDVQLSFRTELGQNALLLSNLDLQKATQEFRESTLVVYVKDIQAPEKKDPVEQSKEVSVEAVQRVLESPEMRIVLEGAVLECLSSPSFGASLISRLSPLVAEKLNEELKEKEEKEEDEKEEEDEEIMEESEENKEEDREKHETGEVEAEGEEDKSEGEKEAFVMIDRDLNHHPVPSTFSAPLFSSFLSFLKKPLSALPSSSSIQMEPLEELCPNVEELLDQLQDMGFSDREANRKALEFHFNYKEGMPEVVEDLLSQSQIQQAKAKENNEEGQSEE